MDTTKWVYVYDESSSFTLPTTHQTYGNMDVAIEIMTSFKRQMLESIQRPDDGDNDDNVWELYKSRICPTVSSFKPLYETNIPISLLRYLSQDLVYIPSPNTNFFLI
ncbi:hypothetical protein BCV72DRAFT_301536 [Rhizopus microsporus var. microsporus]|uniref:Uncharacterized protein n=1 Tax=Rhizopus microsporus var. microsporus TaxID=86635 RepID=A0A1X0RFK2_RHIZD|nr:hypothetical protein BCV72DRAFT_301536 [Rhizopus microsporus var. microsporus]